MPCCLSDRTKLQSWVETLLRRAEPETPLEQLGAAVPVVAAEGGAARRDRLQLAALDMRHCSNARIPERSRQGTHQ